MDGSKGPNEQPKHSHETRDANIRNLLIFGAGLSLLVIAGLVISRAVFRYFVGHQGLGPPASPFEDVRTLPPEPRLQVTAPKDLNQYLAAQNEILNSYGWVDQQAGVVRIPIQRAMDLLLQKGLPVRGTTAMKMTPLLSGRRGQGVVGGGVSVPVNHP
jgi:hypothetical protein